MVWHRACDKPLPKTNVQPVPWRIYAALGGDEFLKAVKFWYASTEQNIIFVAIPLTSRWFVDAMVYNDGIHPKIMNFVVQTIM